MKKLISEVFIIAVACLVYSGYLAGDKAGSHQNMLVPVPDEDKAYVKFSEGDYEGHVSRRNDNKLYVMYSKKGDPLMYYFAIGFSVIIIITRISKYQNNSKKNKTEQVEASDR